MPDLKLYLSQLNIDGQLYDLKDAEARTAINEANVAINETKSSITTINQTIESNEQVTATALNNLNNRIVNLSESINALSNLDPAFLDNLQKVIDELENNPNSAAANAWVTLVDKLKGLGYKIDNVYYTQEEVDTHNGSLTGALDSTNALTSEQATAYNSAITGADKEAGDTLTDEEASLYNSTLEGAISTSDIKTPGVENTVKDYVDGLVSQLRNDINDLGTNKLNSSSVEQVSITQDTFSIENEKLSITTTNLNVLKYK